MRHQKNPITNPMGRGAGGPCLDAGSRSKLTCPTFLRPGRPLSSCPHHATPEVSTGSLGADQAGPPSLRRGAPFPFEVRNGNTIHLDLNTLSGDPSSLTSPKVAVLYGSMTNPPVRAATKHPKDSLFPRQLLLSNILVANQREGVTPAGRPRGALGVVVYQLR